MGNSCKWLVSPICFGGGSSEDQFLPDICFSLPSCERARTAQGVGFHLQVIEQAWVLAWLAKPCIVLKDWAFLQMVAQGCIEQSFNLCGGEPHWC